MSDLIDAIQKAGLAIKQTREEDPRFAPVADIPVSVSEELVSANAKTTYFSDGSDLDIEVFHPQRASSDPQGYRQTVRHELQHAMDARAGTQGTPSRQMLSGSPSVIARVNKMRAYAAQLSFPSVGTTTAGELDMDEMLATLVPVMDDIYNGRKTSGEMREKVEKVVAADPTLARLLFFANRNPTQASGSHTKAKGGWFSSKELGQSDYQKMVESALSSAPTYYPEN